MSAKKEGLGSEASAFDPDRKEIKCYQALVGVSSRYEIGQVTVRGESQKRFSLPLGSWAQAVSVVFSPCLPRFLHFEPVYNPCTTRVRPVYGRGCIVANCIISSGVGDKGMLKTQIKGGDKGKS